MTPERLLELIYREPRGVALVSPRLWEDLKERLGTRAVLELDGEFTGLRVDGHTLVLAEHHVSEPWLISAETWAAMRASAMPAKCSECGRPL